MDQAHCCWLRYNTVSPAISVPKDKYDMQERQRCMILFFFNFKAFLISSAGSLLASKKSNYLLWEKHCNYSLPTTRGDHFASCENIVSRSQTSSLSPPGLEYVQYSLVH